MYYVLYRDHIEDTVHIQIHLYSYQLVWSRMSSIYLTYTWTAFIKFPLSKRDSNSTVVSSESRTVTAACLQPSLLPPIRDLINYWWREREKDI